MPVERTLVDGRHEFEIRAANPENAPFRVVARISASRVPIWQIVNPALSPGGKWLAQALTDGSTTNIWALSTATGASRQVTDFGQRPIFIARRVSWSSDGRQILAAVGEGDADIVLLEGLMYGSRPQPNPGRPHLRHCLMDKSITRKERLVLSQRRVVVAGRE